jgi:hypothetical protein
MLEGPNVGDAHTARHDEVRSVCANEDGTGDEVEESELSFDSLGEDDGDHDRDLRTGGACSAQFNWGGLGTYGEHGENDPEGSHT